MPGAPAVVTVLIPLPVTYNPSAEGHRDLIDDEEFCQTLEDIAGQFGGGILHRFKNDPPQGFWWDRGYLHKDVLAVIEVDIPDTAEAREWLQSYAKTVLAQRFRQEAIYLKFVGPVATMEVRP